MTESSADGYCTTCGAPYGAGQSFCGRCGSRLTGNATDHMLAAAPGAPSGAQAEHAGAVYPDPQPAIAVEDPPYGAGVTAGAVLVSVVMPVIALIAALGLRSQERRPKRRQFLKNWAIGSAIWLCTGWLVGLIAFGAVGSAVSGCQGGIDQSVPPSFQSSDGVHWQATYSCMNGGTETRSVPSSQVPGG